MSKGTFVIDIDDTLCHTIVKDGVGDYENSIPFPDMIYKVNKLYDAGHKIILATARNMRTFNGDVEKILQHTKPILETWLKKHDVKYHEIHFGKPWGKDVVYVDDKCMTTSQFLDLPLRDEDLSSRKSQYIKLNNRILDLTNRIKNIL